MVRIPAFHAGGPGSIPGVGNHFLLSECVLCILYALYQNLSCEKPAQKFYVEHQTVKIVICIYHMHVYITTHEAGRDSIFQTLIDTWLIRFLYANFHVFWVFFFSLVCLFMFLLLVLFLIHLAEFAFLIKGLHLLGL